MMRDSAIKDLQLFKLVNINDEGHNKSRGRGESLE
jgi:hypothetical protein